MQFSLQFVTFGLVLLVPSYGFTPFTHTFGYVTFTPHVLFGYVCTFGRSGCLIFAFILVTCALHFTCTCTHVLTLRLLFVVALVPVRCVTFEFVYVWLLTFGCGLRCVVTLLRYVHVRLVTHLRLHVTLHVARLRCTHTLRWFVLRWTLQRVHAFVWLSFGCCPVICLRRCVCLLRCSSGYAHFYLPLQFVAFGCLCVWLVTRWLVDVARTRLVAFVVVPVWLHVRLFYTLVAFGCVGCVCLRLRLVAHLRLVGLRLLLPCARLPYLAHVASWLPTVARLRVPHAQLPSCLAPFWLRSALFCALLAVAPVRVPGLLAVPTFQLPLPRCRALPRVRLPGLPRLPVAPRLTRLARLPSCPDLAGSQFTPVALPRCPVTLRYVAVVRCAHALALVAAVAPVARALPCAQLARTRLPSSHFVRAAGSFGSSCPFARCQFPPHVRLPSYALPYTLPSYPAPFPGPVTLPQLPRVPRVPSCPVAVRLLPQFYLPYPAHPTRSCLCPQLPCRLAVVAQLRRAVAFALPCLARLHVHVGYRPRGPSLPYILPRFTHALRAPVAALPYLALRSSLARSTQFVVC